MTQPKHFINDSVDCVEEFLLGLVEQYPSHYSRVQHQPVVVYRKQQPRKVALISGGGSGHEPAHAGYVGNGMLTAAVAGGLFASPSVTNIRAALAAVRSSCLLICKNYTGDRLNFGLALSQHVIQHPNTVECRLLVVADDVALENVTQPRGLAGTVLVHKIAGAAAAAGCSLDQVYETGTIVSQHMATLGVALSAVTVPGAAVVNDRLVNERMMEVGLGIHGEAGARQVPVQTADEIGQTMVDTIQKSRNNFFVAGDELVILVNNLGGTSGLELQLVTRAVQTAVQNAGGVVTHVYSGSYMTSFNMHGVSGTLLNLTRTAAAGVPTVREWLEAPTDAPAWHACQPLDVDSKEIQVSVEDVATIDESTLPVVSIAHFGTTATAYLSAACTALVGAEPLLTAHDTIVGDGDCGLTLKRGATAVEQLSMDENVHPVVFFATVARTISNSMGGTSGILLELFFTEMSTFLRNATTIAWPTLQSAAQSGVEMIQHVGGASVGDRTMLDALVPAVQQDSLASAASKAREGADATANLGSAGAGRSNYLSSDVLTGTPDPGAVAVAIVLEAMNRVASS